MDTICLWWGEGSEIGHKTEKRGKVYPAWMGRRKVKTMRHHFPQHKGHSFRTGRNIFSSNFFFLLPLCGKSSFFSSFLLLQMCWTVAVFRAAKTDGRVPNWNISIKSKTCAAKKGKGQKKPRDLSHSLKGAIKTALPSFPFSWLITADP